MHFLKTELCTSAALLMLLMLNTGKITWAFNVVMNDVRADAVPVVLWHGMGDSCCNPMSMGRIQDVIEKHLHPSAYVKSIQIGNSFVQDVENSFFMNANIQIELACKQLNQDHKLKDGYNAVGFSQGGQFLRALAQRCPTPRMFNLISIGGQHQGIFGYPHCMYPNHRFCEYIAKILTYGAYLSYVQNSVVQAEYWHDPINENEYIHKSVFLADINNELNINYTYRQNLIALKNFVMVKFENDTMVIPPETEWFGYFTPGQDKGITTLRNSVLYQEDRLGLKHLDENGKLHFISLPGDHLHFTDEWFVKTIVNKFLSPA